jgi:excinuclease ABC subunit A
VRADSKGKCASAFASQRCRLEYLTPRPSGGVAPGGEAQRIRLATQIGLAPRRRFSILDGRPSDCTSAITRGCRIRFASFAISAISVIVVDARRGNDAAADHLIDLGPGAGKHGGLVIAEGTVAQVGANKDSITAATFA